jgi:beta-mannanase
VQVNLIPVELEDVNHPLSWERACANGDYDSYASELGNSLVEVGLENTVIRLGPEMNGKWEADFVGSTYQEQRLWSTCFANEVTALRGVTGAHFLIDWNPNACKGRIPYMNYYPGSAYVDIVGLDLFDVGCITPTQSLTFQQLASEPYGLGSFEAFAAKQDKPMSFPEWALSSVPAGDDPQFISGMGKTVESQDFAFETYFDGGGDGAKALALGPRTPRSLVAFRQWFRHGS